MVVMPVKTPGIGVCWLWSGLLRMGRPAAEEKLSCISAAVGVVGYNVDRAFNCMSMQRHRYAAAQKLSRISAPVGRFNCQKEHCQADPSFVGKTAGVRLLLSFGI